jgi:hypothetical protein
MLALLMKSGMTGPHSLVQCPPAAPACIPCTIHWPGDAKFSSALPMGSEGALNSGCGFQMAWD